MTKDARARVDDALGSGNFSDLIGLMEDKFFEAKGAGSYNLDALDDQFELAKDASSFANADGGVIVVGLKNKRLLSTSVDEVGGLDLQPQAYFDAGRFDGIIRTHVYPKIVGLTTQWVPDARMPETGALVIRIPRQADEVKPFLITKVVEDGRVMKQIVAGYAIRRGPDSVPLSPRELQQGLKTGMSPSGQRLTRIEEKLDLLLEQRSSGSGDQPGIPADTNGRVPSLGARIRRILEDDS